MRKREIARRIVMLVIITIMTSGIVKAQENRYDYLRHSTPEGYIAPDDPSVVAKLEQWKDLKFGVIFHWGLYSVPGICESWPLCSEDWVTRPEGYTYESFKKWYWGLINEFSPVDFNPDQWAEVTSKAGMKYLVFTTKHHDGFCMFDTKETDFSVTHAPLFKENPKADVTKYIVDAFRKQNMWIGLYFSKPDWHSQLFWNDAYGCAGRGRNYWLNNDKNKKMWEDYGVYCRNQMIEITNNYGPIDILWMDGGWIEAKDVRIEEVLSSARKVSPGMISVDRAMRSKWENYITPEQSIPEAQLTVPWESCITLTQSWDWNPEPEFKTANRVISMLAEVVAKGGSLLLGVGPTPQGLIQKESVERLDTIGKWLKLNGEAIYGTRTTPIYTNEEKSVWFTADKEHTLLYAIIPATDHKSISWRGNTPKGKIINIATGKSVKYEVKNGVTTMQVDKSPMAVRFTADEATVSIPKSDAEKSITERYANLLTPTEKYVANRTTKQIKIDGALDADEWKNANVTNLFTDISGEGHPTPRFKTNAMMLWDDDYLYVGATLEEPDIWAYITERDSVIYFDNDFEIFIDPDNDGKNYYEMEFNAIGNIFDLFIEHAYRSPDSCHVNFSWNSPGLKVATKLNGTLNDNRDTDRGWTIEVAIPRTAINHEFRNVLEAGKTLSVGFSRVEWKTDKLPDGNYAIRKDKNGKKLPEDNWTWGATGRVAMHMPERWGKVYLSDRQTGGNELFPENPDEGLTKILWAMFYRQEEEHFTKGRYLNDIPLTADEKKMTCGADIRIEATDNTYEIIATKTNGEILILNHNGSFSRRKRLVPAFKAYGWYVWESDKVSEDSLFRLFREWHSHGLRGICANNGFDYEKIERCALIAHRAGLEYHAWAPTVIHGGKDSTWYTVNRLGKSAFNAKERAYVEYYQTLDPHNPEVIRFLTESYLKMAAIPHVDYVQLDYIRYADAILAEGLWDKYDSQIHHQWRDKSGKVHEFPGADYCYCDACCADFLSKTGIDIRRKMAEGVDPSTIKEWAQFRCDIVTNLVNTICDSIHAHGYKISADVFPGPENYAEPMVRQQWRKWDVDILFPMNYNDFYLKDSRWVKDITKQEVNGTRQPVVSGLFICPDWKNKEKVIDPENSGLLPSELGAAIKGSLAAGAKAICLFTPDRMSAEHWEVFERLIIGK